MGPTTPHHKMQHVTKGLALQQILVRPKQEKMRWWRLDWTGGPL